MILRMQHLKKLVSVSFFLGMVFHVASAQPLRPLPQGTTPPDGPPTFELDKKGKRAHINFGLNPKAISDANLKFSHFANRKLLIYYFSAKCPHCQHAYPHVQKLADELASQGFATLAIALKWNTEDDIRGFIRDYFVHVPVFFDADRSFGENYGTGSIPLLLLVNEKGEYIRYKTFETETTPAMVRAEAALLAKK
jgi:thiol-disulfide isomerase/thioredoxin